MFKCYFKNGNNLVVDLLKLIPNNMAALLDPFEKKKKKTVPNRIERSHN